MTTHWSQTIHPHSPVAVDDWQQGRLAIAFSEPPLQGLGDLLARTFRAYRATLPLLLGLTMSLMIPLDVVISFLDSSPDELIRALASVLRLMQSIVGSLIAGAVAYGVAIHRREQRVAPMGEALRWGLIHWARMFGYTLLVGLIVLGGLLLLIVPGILFAVWFLLVTPIVAVEGKGRPGVLGRSKKLTEGHRGMLCGAFLLMMVVFFLMGVAAGFVDVAVGEWWVAAITAAVLSLVAMFFPVMITVAYLAITAEERGLCANCGYNLTGNTSGLCPECGVPTPATVEPWETA